MPSQPRHVVVALTADQVGSRRGVDAVPQALDALADVPNDGASARRFARTAGDEIQALFESPTEVLTALSTFARLGVWRVGVGIGLVDLPVPHDVRAASGDALVAARAAVEAARTSSAGMAVRAPAAPEEAARLEAVLGLLDMAWRRRTAAGWQVAALMAEGASQRAVAAELKVSPSAVSQRVRAAAIEEADAGQALAVWLLEVTVKACRSSA